MAVAEAPVGDAAADPAVVVAAVPVVDVAARAADAAKVADVARAAADAAAAVVVGAEKKKMTVRVTKSAPFRSTALRRPSKVVAECPSVP